MVSLAWLLVAAPQCDVIRFENTKERWKQGHARRDVQQFCNPIRIYYLWEKQIIRFKFKT
jgi:hypothetical protein